MPIDRKVQRKAPTSVAKHSATSGAGSTGLWSDALVFRQPLLLWRRLGLAGRFFLLSGLVVGLPMLFLGWVVNSEVRQARISAAARINAFYINQLAGPLLDTLPLDVIASPETDRRLDQWIANWPRRLPEAIHILLRDGTVAYSTDTALIGTPLLSEALTLAFQGEVVADIEMTRHGVERQNVAGEPLLEIYIPLYRNGSDEIVAVAEIYERAADLQAAIGRTSRNIWALVATTTALILVLLFLTIQATETIIASQRRQIRQRLARSIRLTRLNTRLRREAIKARLEAIESNERMLNKIGYDIHDGPIQLLSLLTLQLGVDERAQPARIAATAPSHAVSLATEAIRELRNLSNGLTLPELEDLDTEETIRLAVIRHENLTGTRVELALDELPSAMDATLKICIYRVVQEGLTNAYRHAGGNGQKVLATTGGEWLDVTISDGGPQDRKKPRSAPGTGLGLRGLNNRLALVGGTLHMATAKGGGTVLLARMPVNITLSGPPFKDIAALDFSHDGRQGRDRSNLSENVARPA